MAGSRINCSKIAAAVRAKYPDITWVSVELEGSRLRLKIQEGIFVEKEEDSEKESCDLEDDKKGDRKNDHKRRGTSDETGKTLNQVIC